VRVLVVCAVPQERRAVREAVPRAADIEIACGVGPVAAAAAAGRALGGGRFDLVLSAGIGGGFTPLAPGEIAVASTIVFADLGAETPAGFVPISELGFGGVEQYDVAPRLSLELTDRTGGRLGTVLTVATVTGSAESASALSRRFPDAVAEGMEGAGVAAAAVAHGVPFAEIRAISNLVGPRDRTAWQIPLALESLGRAVAAAVAS
jgi:futalosine hydrolase